MQELAPQFYLVGLKAEICVAAEFCGTFKLELAVETALEQAFPDVQVCAFAYTSIIKPVGSVTITLDTETCAFDRRPESFFESLEKAIQDQAANVTRQTLNKLKQRAW